MLMEAAPAGMDAREIGEAMAAEPDVTEVHDLHVWTVTSGFPGAVGARGGRPGVRRDLFAADSSGCSRTASTSTTRPSRWSSARIRSS